MSKLINLIHPYEVENIKTINDFFIVLKNLLRLSSKKILEKKDGILIPTRWSNKKNKWVVDRGTDLNRDIEGICEENIKIYFKESDLIYQAIYFTLKILNSNSKLDLLFEKFNLKKNENKFFAFEYCNNKTNIINNSNESIYPIGLFQRCQTKKRSGVYLKNINSVLIDNSYDILNKVSNCSNLIDNINYYKIYNYHELFNRFFIEMQEKTYTLTLKDKILNIKVIDYINKDLNKSVKHSDILKAIDDSSEIDQVKFNKLKINVILYLVYFDFYNFIKNYLNINKKEIEGFVVPDEQNNIFYKITGNFVLEVYRKNKTKKNAVLLPPIMPGVF